MHVEHPCPAEELLAALIGRLLHAGILRDDDIASIGDDLSSKARQTSGSVERDRLESAAHIARCVLVEAATPSEADFLANKARGRFRVIEGDA